MIWNLDTVISFLLFLFHREDPTVNCWILYDSVEQVTQQQKIGNGDLGNFA